MCQTCVEFAQSGRQHRRCQDNWSDERRQVEAGKANARRRRNRSIQSSFTACLRASLGDEVADEVKKVRPNQLALVANRVADHDPALAETLRASVNGKYPGTHNMVFQEIRANSAYTDHDLTGALKADPMNVSAAMAALNAVDAAALEAGKVPEDQREALARELQLRQEAVALKLGDPTATGPVSAEQAAFYSVHSYDELGRPNERLEDKARADVFQAARVQMEPRAVLLDDDQSYLNAEELAAGQSRTRMRKGLEVAEGVLLKRDSDGTLYYSVDGDFRLPASQAGFVHDEVANIPAVTKIDYSRDDAPAGQTALFERMCNDPHTDMAVEEAVLRTAFTSDKATKAMMTPGEAFTFDVAERPGISGAPLDRLAAVGHRRDTDFDASSPVSPVANRHLRRAGDVKAAARTILARRSGVGDALDARRTRRDLRAAESEPVGGLVSTPVPAAGQPGRTPEDDRVDAGLAAWRRKNGERRVAASRNTGELETAAFSDAPVSGRDVDLAVARANGYAAAGGPDLAVVDPAAINSAHDTDTCDTGMLCDYLRVRDAVGDTELVHAASDAAPSTVSMAAYTSVPEDTDLDELFAYGSAHSPSQYVSAASNARKPRRAPGTRTVRVVYTTSDGARITPQRTIIGPDQSFRVASTSTDRLGVTTVHMVEDAVCAAAAE
jgi:hypothetical protein